MVPAKYTHVITKKDSFAAFLLMDSTNVLLLKNNEWILHLHHWKSETSAVKLLQKLCLDFYIVSILSSTSKPIGAHLTLAPNGYRKLEGVQTLPVHDVCLFLVVIILYELAFWI